MFFVYVLKSLRNNRLYTGSTNNLERRLHEHNSGQTKYTSYAGPFELIYQETYNTRVEAGKRERFLKSGRGREFLKLKLGS